MNGRIVPWQNGVDYRDCYCGKQASEMLACTPWEPRVRYESSATWKPRKQQVTYSRSITSPVPTFGTTSDAENCADGRSATEVHTLITSSDSKPLSSAPSVFVHVSK